MRVVLAPGWFAATTRSLLVIGAMLLVTAGMLGAKGAPRTSRRVQWNEFALFAPRPVEGTAQLGGEMVLVTGLSWACGGFLKIRL